MDLALEVVEEVVDDPLILADESYLESHLDEHAEENQEENAVKLKFPVDETGIQMEVTVSEDHNQSSDSLSTGIDEVPLQVPIKEEEEEMHLNSNTERYWALDTNISRVKESDYMPDRGNNSNSQQSMDGASNECNICGMQFEKEKNFKRHMLEHRTENRRLRCEFCGKLFQKSGHLMNHRRKHALDLKAGRNEKKKKKVRRRKTTKDLVSHRRKPGVPDSSSHELMAGESFMCPKCDMYFTSLKELEMHKKLHKPKSGKEKEPEKCQYCGQKLATKQRLHEHERLHGGDLPFKCPRCDIAYPLATHLSRHQRSCNHF